LNDEQSSQVEMMAGDRDEERGDTLMHGAAGPNGTDGTDNTAEALGTKDDEVQAQVGDGTSPSGGAERGGPISGRIEGESDPAADSSATKLDTEAGGNPFMGTDTEESSPALDAHVPSAGELPAEEELPALDSQMPAADEMSAIPMAEDTVNTAGTEMAQAEIAPTPDAAELDDALSLEAAPAPGSEQAVEEVPVRSARIGQVPTNASMEDLMRAADQQFKPLKHGDVIEGRVMKVDRDEILIDIGGKTEGIIPSREATSMSVEEREGLQPGDELLVSVVQPESNEGHVVLSLDRARQEKAWRDLQRIHETGETIQAQVIGHNKGGLLVNIQGIRGFIPSSQVSSLPPGEANKQAEMSRLHNQSLPLKVIEINRNRNRLILSERQAVQEQRESMRTRLLQELEPGQIRPGTVTSVCDFGAFVDIGGADGLIHLSELSWKRVSHPREVLNVGDRINVYVLSVDPNERKIALSLKRTQPEPWETITQQYTLGQTVRGTITQITTFGAFARLEDGIEGLIHVSELAEGRVQHPRNVVKEGEVHDLKVIRIDPARKRIGLSLKRAQEELAPPEGETALEEGETTQEMSGVEVPTYQEPAPQPQPQQAQQQPASSQQPREQRQPQQPRERDRDRDRDRDRRAQTGPAMDIQVEDTEDMPMGAMAHAFAALQRQRGDILAGDEEAEQPPAEQAPIPAEMEETVSQAAAGEELGSLSGLTTSRDMDATDAMGGVEFEAGTEGDTTDVFPEADANAGSEATGDVVEGTGPAIGETEDSAADSSEEAEAAAADTTEAEAAPEEEVVSQTAAPEEEEAEAPAEEDTAEAASATDVATDSGDMPAEEEAESASDTEVEAEASMPVASDVSEAAEAAETGETEDAAETADETEADGDASDDR
jgi:small subunit ribosomal protein S1